LFKDQNINIKLKRKLQSKCKNYKVKDFSKLVKNSPYVIALICKIIHVSRKFSRKTLLW